MTDRIKLDKPPYKGERGHWLLRQLFVEYEDMHNDDRNSYVPIFSLMGKEGYIDVGATFVALRDPTGRLWAERYLGSWEHWTRLEEASWFSERLSKWRDEIDTIFTSEAIQRVREIAAGESSQALAASKYLAEKGWQKTRGRPSKAEINGELKRQVKIIEAHEEDAERIGLKIIKGGKS